MNDMNPEPLTLNRLHEMWSAVPRWRKLAVTTRQAALAAFLRDHGETPLSRCTAAQMSRWLDEATTVSSDTVLALSCLRNLFAWAKEQHLTNVDPARIAINPDIFNSRRTACNTQAAPEPTVPDSHKERAGRREPIDYAPIAPIKRNAPKDRSEDSRMKKAVGAVKKVGSRLKRTAEKALHHDLSRKGSTHWRNRTIGDALSGKSGKSGPKVAGGTAYTDVQNTARNVAKRLGYRVGSSADAGERLRIYICPDTQRSALREHRWISHGFTLHHLHGTPAAPLERVEFDQAKSNLVGRCKKKGFIFDGQTVIIPQGTRLDPRTERALRWKGFTIIDN
jgi:hypothetical protein